MENGKDRKSTTFMDQRPNYVTGRHLSPIDPS